MFCRHCGAQIPDEAVFCTTCGQKVERQTTVPEPQKDASLTQSAEPVKNEESVVNAAVGDGAKPAETPVSKEEPIQKQDAKAKKEKIKKEKIKKEKTKKEKTKKGKAACVALSVLICILMIIFGVYAETIFLVRSATGKGAVAALVKDLDISEIRMNFGGEEGDTLTDYIVDQAGGVFKEYITKRKVQKLLKQEFVTKFLEEKINDYVGDIFGETGKGVVEVREVKKLLEGNDDAIFKIIDPEMKTYFPGDPYDYLEEELEEYGTLEMTDISRYRAEQPLVFSLIKNLLSYWMLAVLLVLILALAVGVFLLQQRRIKGFCYVGVSLIIIGIVSLAVSFTTGIMASELEQGIGFEREFWQQILAPVRTNGLIVGIILAGSGAVCYVINIVGKAVQKKRAGAPVKKD